MKLYLCQDGTYAGTQADAKLRGKDFLPVEVPVDKPGLLSFLNQFVNAVEDLREPDPDRVVKDINDDIRPEPTPVNYTETSVKLDELVANSPLAQRLTWASLALEDARSKLFPVDDIIKWGGGQHVGRTAAAEDELFG